MATGTPTGRGKQKMVAGLLALLIGWTGAHHFYLGSTMAGVICILTCGACGLFSLVEGIMLLIMDDNEFNNRYNARTPEPMEFVFMKPK